MIDQELRLDRVTDVLNRLLEWEAQQGGYEASCWRAARELRDDLLEEREPTEEDEREVREKLRSRHTG